MHKILVIVVLVTCQFTAVVCGQEADITGNDQFSLQSVTRYCRYNNGTIFPSGGSGLSIYLTGMGGGWPGGLSVAPPDFVPLASLSSKFESAVRFPDYHQQWFHPVGEPVFLNQMISKAWSRNLQASTKSEYSKQANGFQTAKLEHVRTWAVARTPKDYQRNCLLKVSKTVTVDGGPAETHDSFVPVIVPANDTCSSPVDFKPGILTKLVNNLVVETTFTNRYKEEINVSLLPVEVVPDYNRDGKIDSADRGKISDEKPWRWWVNDDDDVDSPTGGDIPESNSPDHANAQVDGMRDLIDFFPIHLDIKMALLVMPKSEYQYFIKHSDGGMKLFEFPSGVPNPAEDDLSRGPNSHITNTSRASGFANYAVTSVTSAGVPLSNGYLNQAEAGKGLLLLEATKETTSPLQLEIRKGSQVIATINFPVKISKVENMYRHTDLTQVPLDYDGGSPGAAASPIGTKTVDPGSAYPDSLTNGKYFVFLHGFNVPVQRARGWNAEIFKRMHQMGSKARFVGITWTGATGIPIAGTPSNIGNAESSTDYHKAVFFAMQTGGALAPALAFTQGEDVTVAAHSLGNMVVGEAIQNGGFTPDRYYIVNGAVPTETYDPGLATDAERWAMTEAQWKPYGTIHQQRLYSSSWHTLFPASDNRSKLTWKNRFERVRRLGLSHNFYSTGDEVVQNPTSDTAVGGIVAEFVSTRGASRGAWGNQEFMKGTELALYLQSRYQGGWGFNFNPEQFTEYQGYVKPTFGGFRKYYPEETPANVPGGVTDDQLKTKPFFKPFKEFDLLSPTLGSAKAGELKVQRDVLATGVPARSYAIAANPVSGLAGNQNMDELRTWPNSWPAENHDGESAGQWLHSDFRDVAINYLHKMYGKMIELGELNED